MKRNLKPAEKKLFLNILKQVLLERKWNKLSGNVFQKEYPFMLHGEKYVFPLEVEIFSRMISISLVLRPDNKKELLKAYMKEYVEKVNVQFSYVEFKIPTVHKTSTSDSKLVMKTVRRGITPPPVFGDEGN